MYVIGKRFRFSAGHRLPDLPAGHKCRNQHGHNYWVEVTLQTDNLDEQGMVRDYGELGPLRDWVNAHWDHQNLNDTLPQPTAEVLAEALFTVAESLGLKPASIRVQETDDTFAEYRP